VLPRPPHIQTDTISGFLITGGIYGVKIHLGKRQKWFGTRKNYMYLPSWSERKWLFDEIARFQEEVPVTQPVDTTRPVEKGLSSDSTYGKNLLDTLELHGKRLVRVVPGNESAMIRETTGHLPPGVLQIRCIHCHRLVPRDHVSQERLIAKCPHCDAVFRLSEMEQTGLPHRGRVHLRRDDDSLTIVQRPHRTGLPLCMVILFLLLDAGCIALYLWLQKLFPGEDPLTYLRAKGNPDIAIGYRLVVMYAVTHILFLILPLWAMFDKRVIRIDREVLRITGSWLFVFRWKRTLPRVSVQLARFHVLEVLFQQARLCYGNRSVYLGCRSAGEVEAVCAEINHFLYTVLPWPVEHLVFPPPEPAFVGGVDSGCPEIHLHCPDCGTQYPAASLDFPQQVAHCPDCQKTTPLEHAVSYPVNIVENKPADDLLVEKTDDRLSIQYSRSMDKALKYANLIGGYFIVFMFGSMMLGIVYWLFTDEKINVIGRCLLLVIFVLPLSVMIIIIFFKFAQEANVIYCDWGIRVTRTAMTLEHRYRRREKTIVIPREKIVRAELNHERVKLADVFRPGTYPAGFFENRESRGAHILLTDGTKQYLPLLSLNTNKTRDTTRWLAATLNEFLASHPGKKQQPGA
ncbi:MAG: zinc-ribbon domain-containing protein, partial [Planctomycetaceae bacterium]|nr:zinc-ribbon domain-containing protein [Planctomycetaceae bacterium]